MWRSFICQSHYFLSLPLQCEYFYCNHHHHHQEKITGEFCLISHSDFSLKLHGGHGSYHSWPVIDYGSVVTWGLLLFIDQLLPLACYCLLISCYRQPVIDYGSVVTYQPQPVRWSLPALSPGSLGVGRRGIHPQG